MNLEYMSCRIEIDLHLVTSAKLNELGKAGWELVQVLPIQDVAHQFRAFFKRQISNSN
jgi:hypothetical protein